MTSPVRLVLVGTKSPGNLGAVCRLAKAFGFPEVWLVHSSVDPAHAEAVRLAHGAEDVLQRVAAAATLGGALVGCARAYATTARPRDWSRRVLAPEDLAREAAHERAILAAATPGSAPLAIVFGPEDRGLTNEELARCDAIVSIPVPPETEATLSLPSAAAIVAYALRRGLDTEHALPAARSERSSRGSETLSSAGVDELLEEILQTLSLIGFRARPNETRFRGSLRDFLARAHPTKGDHLFLRNVLSQAGKWKRRLEEAKSKL